MDAVHFQTTQDLADPSPFIPKNPKVPNSKLDNNLFCEINFTKHPKKTVQPS